MTQSIRHFFSKTTLKTLSNSANARLLFALILSVLIHALLVSTFHWRIPSFDEKNTILEARMVQRASPEVKKTLKKSVEKKPEILKQKVKKTTIKPVKHTQIKPEVENRASATDNAPEITSSLPTETAEVVTPNGSEITPSDALAMPSNRPDPDVQSPDQIGAQSASVAAIPDVPIGKPYTYVEMGYEVKGTLKTSMIDISIHGNGDSLFQSSDGKYTLSQSVTVTGYKLTQQSEGTITDKGLMPTEYRYNFNNKPNKNYTAHFNWDEHILDLHSLTESKHEPLEMGTQDLISFMYQFMFTPPLNEMKVTMTNGRKIATYDYMFEGEQVLETNMGKLNTTHVYRVNDAGTDKIELWLAQDYMFLPVKISVTDKNGHYELLATHIQTKDVATNQPHYITTSP